MRQDGLKATPGKQVFLQRLALTVMLQLLLSLGVCGAVGAVTALREWVETWEQLGTGSAVVIVSIAVSVRAIHYKRLESYPGYFLFLLFSLSVIYLLGCHFPVFCSQPSLFLGLILLFLQSFLCWVYLLTRNPPQFQAYILIPMGLLITLALYAGILYTLPQVYLGDLLLWTCISGVYTLYVPLKLQYLQTDSPLTSSDLPLAMVLLYTDIVPGLYTLFTS